MDQPLQILVLEDVPTDFELMNHALRRAGLSFESKRVEDGDHLFVELRKHEPDVILSDHGHPGIDSLTLLELIKHRCPEVPFVVVTGAMDEETVARMFERGADGCVFKHRLNSELAPTVRRVVGVGSERRRLRAVEMERDQLRRELEELRAAKAKDNFMVVCAGCKKSRNEQDEWCLMEELLMERFGITLSHGMCPDCMRKHYGFTRLSPLERSVD